MGKLLVGTSDGVRVSSGELSGREVVDHDRAHRDAGLSHRRCGPGRAVGVNASTVVGGQGATKSLSHAQIYVGISETYNVG